MEKTSMETGTACTAAEKWEFSMNSENNRLSTFKDWPFDDNCQCVPSKMAAAGFYHIPTDQQPDLVRCFVCYKELEGWEPDDDPWAEHRRHQPNCDLLKIMKNHKSLDEITVKEFLDLECKRQQNRTKAQIEERVKEFRQQAARVREQMELL
ncbi:baculoviral IAP repeat-containing protein 5-like [Branchiostoma floridae x Branchiostoma belcheri]|nr:Baculoviral IAP repeat-containing protein 5 [Branchiostoma belcheri]